MFCANFWRELGDDRIRAFAGLALPPHALSQIDDVIAHRVDDLDAAEVAMPGHHNRWVP